MPKQQLILKSQRQQLMDNWHNRIAHGKGGSFFPVVKLFHAYGAGTWLITEMNPEMPDEMFGLCDLGMGFPELGYVSLSELESARHPMGWQRIERDIHWQADKNIGQYADEARKCGHIRA
jgi:hypothetical protein